MEHSGELHFKWAHIDFDKYITHPIIPVAPEWILHHKYSALPRSSIFARLVVVLIHVCRKNKQYDEEFILSEEIVRSSANLKYQFIIIIIMSASWPCWVFARGWVQCLHIQQCASCFGAGVVSCLSGSLIFTCLSFILATHFPPKLKWCDKPGNSETINDFYSYLFLTMN
jgi:hypothetical protein